MLYQLSYSRLGGQHVIAHATGCSKTNQLKTPPDVITSYMLTLGLGPSVRELLAGYECNDSFIKEQSATLYLDALRHRELPTRRIPIPSLLQATF